MPPRLLRLVYSHYFHWRWWVLVPFCACLAMTPENYTSVLQFVSSSLPPFLERDGKPSLPLFAWLATFSGTLLTHQVFGGSGADLTDPQKNWLLLDILVQHGKQRLGLSVDGVHSPLNTTPCHAATRGPHVLGELGH